MPPLPPLLRDQRAVDASHLKLLAIFHFVSAGFGVLGLGFMVFQFAFMQAMFTSHEFVEQWKGPPLPEFFFSFLRGFFIVMGIVVAVRAVANLVSGFCLLKRRGRVFSLIAAGCNCLSMPLGTTLGVFTFVVLLRRSVQDLYAAASPHILSRLARPPVAPDLR